MKTRRIALLLTVVGLLCLPAPLYLSAAANAAAPPPKISQAYTAEPYDLGRESDQRALVRDHGDDLVLLLSRVTTSDNAGEYNAPNATAESLRTSMANGSASVESDGARRDLRVIDARYRFVSNGTERADYYRLAVENGGSTVRAEQVSVRVVAETIAADASRYENLTESEQRTIDPLLNGTVNGEWGYRPRVNDPYVDELPTPIRKNDTLYIVSEQFVPVDDFGAGVGGFFIGLPVAAVGVLLLLIAGGLFLSDRHPRSDQE